jgi:hypothetical protein
LFFLPDTSWQENKASMVQASKKDIEGERTYSMNSIVRTIMSVIFALLWGGTLVLVYFLATSVFARFDTYMNVKIVHDCAQDYRSDLVNQDTGRTVSRPLEQQVRECSWQKGLKTGWEGVWSVAKEETVATDEALTPTPTKAKVTPRK